MDTPISVLETPKDLILLASDRSPGSQVDKSLTVKVDSYESPFSFFQMKSSGGELFWLCFEGSTFRLSNVFNFGSLVAVIFPGYDNRLITNALAEEWFGTENLDKEWWD